jgi:hypothetical protein
MQQPHGRPSRSEERMADPNIDGGLAGPEELSNTTVRETGITKRSAVELQDKVGGGAIAVGEVCVCGCRPVPWTRTARCQTMILLVFEKSETAYSSIVPNEAGGLPLMFGNSV